MAFILGNIRPAVGLGRLHDRQTWASPPGLSSHAEQNSNSGVTRDDQPWAWKFESALMAIHSGRCTS